MQLHQIISVTETAEQNTYIAHVDITDAHGERYDADYVSREGDAYGLAPAVREAVEQWIADGNAVAPYVPPPLDGVKAALKARLDEAAEAERLKYITGGAGQAMEYQQAAAEATALLAAMAADPGHAPAPADYPMLSATVGIDGDDLVDVATTIAGMHAQWQAIGATIKAARMLGKQAIDAATTAQDAQAAFDAVEWPAAQASS